MADVKFPFMIVHDPKDASAAASPHVKAFRVCGALQQLSAAQLVQDSVCLVQGSEKLMALSPSDDKVMHRVDAGAEAAFEIEISSVESCLGPLLNRPLHVLASLPGGLHVLTFVMQEEYARTSLFSDSCSILECARPPRLFRVLLD